MPRGSAPGERRGGRQAGTPNVLPDLRAITLKALMKAGGVDYLVRQSEENPLGFMSLLGRVMPRESHVELSGEVKMRQEVRRDLVDKVIVLMRAPMIEAASQDITQTPAIEATASALPAITHNPETLLRAQVAEGRESLTRRGETARREAISTVSGAVQRASAMHTERNGKGKERMSYQEEALARIDGIKPQKMSSEGV